MITCYTHARAYAEAKWGNLAPVSRRSVAEALVTVTIALTGKEPGAPEPKVLRQAAALRFAGMLGHDAAEQ